MSISQNFPAVSPSLNLNFARSKKLDPRITFTRSSSATRTNAQGLVETVSANIPRFDHSYNSSTGSVNSLGLLIEESRTNLITYSDYSSGNSVNNVTLTANATTAPDGTNTAISMTGNAGTSVKYLYKQYTTTTTGTYTTSVFAKYNGEQYILLRVNDNTGVNDGQQRFDILNGTVSGSVANGGTATGASSTITPYPNGWYRLTVTCTFNSALTSIQGASVYLTGYTSTSSTNSVYLWAPQLEAGAFATSYIPTVASTVTRTGDLAYIDLPSNNWYNYSQGSLIFQHSTVPYATGTSPGYPAIGFAQTNGSSTNSIQYFFNKSSNSSQYLVRDANVDQANINPNNTATAKVGFAYTTNSFVLARNGSQVGTDTSGTVPQSIGTLLLGTNTKDVTTNMNACISNVIYYPRALTSTQLQNLTK